MSSPAPQVPPNVFDAPQDAQLAGRKYLPHVAGAHAPGAWKSLTDALGTGLQGGMWRAEQSRRRLARLR